MLLDKFPPMTGATSPNRVGVVDGGKDQHGRRREVVLAVTERYRSAMVKLTGHESLSGETVRRRLAENGLKPWRKDMWCIPRGEYVARMEDVLDLYAEARDPKRPVV